MSQVLEHARAHECKFWVGGILPREYVAGEITANVVDRFEIVVPVVRIQ